VLHLSARAHARFIRLDSRFLSRLRRPGGRFDTELLGVLGVQPLPAAEVPGLGADDAADRFTPEEALRNIGGDVPACGGPRRVPSAAGTGLELSPLA